MYNLGLVCLETGSHCVAQDSLKNAILLPQPPKFHSGKFKPNFSKVYVPDLLGKHGTAE